MQSSVGFLEISRSFTARSKAAWSIMWVLCTVVAQRPGLCPFPKRILPYSNNYLYSFCVCRVVSFFGLMSLLYMDLDIIDAIIQQLSQEFWKLAATKKVQHHQNAPALLDDLHHICFQQFRLDMNCRFTYAK